MDNNYAFGSLGDILDPKRRLLDPFPAYRRRRATAPVFFDPKLDSWSVFRFADVERVLSEHTTFSSRFELSDRAKRARAKRGEGEPLLDSTILTSDPPRHHQLRGLVSKAFNPKATAEWAPRIAEIAAELLDKALPDGKMEVVHDFAAPLPITVIAEMLGVPTADLERFKRWSNELVSVSNMEDRDRLREDNPAAKEMRAYFKERIAEHRRAPKDDLIGRLVDAEIDGQRLSERELVDFCILLLVAGNITTTNLIGNAIICFDRHPEVMAELRAAPELLPSAIEEVLRYFSPVQAMFRVVVVDTVLGGQRLRAGQTAIGWIGAANRDEAEFADPDRFDIRRSPNRHVGFGKGIHYCLGAHLARLEAKIALGAMLERIREIRIEPGAALEPIESSFLFAAKRVPIVFEAAGRQQRELEIAALD